MLIELEYLKLLQLEWSSKIPHGSYNFFRHDAFIEELSRIS